MTSLRTPRMQALTDPRIAQPKKALIHEIQQFRAESFLDFEFKIKPASSSASTSSFPLGRCEAVQDELLSRED